MMYELRAEMFGKEVKIPLADFKDAFKWAMIYYTNGKSVDVINTCTGEVVLILNDKQFYISDNIKYVM